MRIILYLNILVLCFRTQANCDVSSGLGNFRGLFESETQTCSFRNISYAEPFTRLETSRVLNSRYAGVVNATNYGPICAQFDLPDPDSLTWEQSESCLSLNVHAPQNLSGDPIPVLFWVHGGDFIQGAGRLYDGKWLAHSHNVVVVTINYRLGALGFYSDEDGIGGMNGILDQINALRYVQRYIRDFGGDPNQVTIFGQGAGAVSICLLLHIPMSEGLFSQAIVQSGSCYPSSWPTRNEKDGIEASQKFLQLSDMSEDFFRNAPLQDILLKINPLSHMLHVLGPSPSIDGLILPSGPLDMPLTNSLESIMVGFTSADIPLMGPPDGNYTTWTKNEINSWLDTYFGKELREEIWNLYGIEAESWRIPLDLCTTCPISRMNERAEMENIKTYSYIYDYPEERSGHGADIEALWNMTGDSLNTPESIIKDMMQTFALFAKNKLQHGSDWRNAIRFQKDGMSEASFSDESICDFWNDISETHQSQMFTICSCLAPSDLFNCGSSSTTSTTAHPKSDDETSSGQGWILATIILSAVLFLSILLHVYVLRHKPHHENYQYHAMNCQN